MKIISNHTSQSIKSEERIFRAAMHEFLDKGRHGARMQSIADSAGINKAMLHYYFRNKETLYGYVLQKALDKLYGCLPEIFEKEMPFSVTLRLFIDGYLDLLNSNPRIPRFILQEAAENPQTVQALIRDSATDPTHTLLKAFTTHVEKAVKAKHIRNIDPLQFFMTVMGAGLYFFLAEPILTDGLDMDREVFIQQRKKHLFDIIYNGLRPE